MKINYIYIYIRSLIHCAPISRVETELPDNEGNLASAVVVIGLPRVGDKGGLRIGDVYDSCMCVRA